MIHTLTLPALQKERRFSDHWLQRAHCGFPGKSHLPGLVGVIVAEQEGFFTVVAIGKYNHTARILFSTAPTKGDTVGMIERVFVHRAQNA